MTQQSRKCCTYILHLVEILEQLGTPLLHSDYSAFLMAEIMCITLSTICIKHTDLLGKLSLAGMEHSLSELLACTCGDKAHHSAYVSTFLSLKSADRSTTLMWVGSEARVPCVVACGRQQNAASMLSQSTSPIFTSLGTFVAVTRCGNTSLNSCEQHVIFWPEKMPLTSAHHWLAAAAHRARRILEYHTSSIFGCLLQSQLSKFWSSLDSQAVYYYVSGLVSSAEVSHFSCLALSSEGCDLKFRMQSQQADDLLPCVTAGP